MADISKINLYGTEYSIKDNTARELANTAKSTADTAKSTADTAKSTANTANSKADSNATNITNIKNESISITYNSTDESIEITKGITI